MNKAILLSIKPLWVAEILNGNKTIEIRKTYPKCDLPIDVYIYCTKDKSVLRGVSSCAYSPHPRMDGKSMMRFNKDFPILNGKVVAKFTLRKVEEVHCFNNYEGCALKSFYFTDTVVAPEEFERMCCLTKEEIWQYAPYISYAWYIEDLVIFDKPKRLTWFRGTTINYDFIGKPYHPFIKKAPQSYCYVEVE